MITIVADESIDKQIVDKLRDGGFRVLYITEDFPSLNDEDILIKANEVNSIIVTADKDFGELIYNKNMNAHGIILIRLGNGDFHLPRFCHSVLDTESYENRSKIPAFAGMTDRTD